MGVIDSKILLVIKLFFLSLIGFFVIAESGLFTFMAMMYFYVRFEALDEERYRERTKEWRSISRL